ncbi:hypothetical protein SCATT_45220 [Streptantibioticus cattleyicolor NRRL 8057 = DSM 46488]|uniref:Uncharacterized protein n=1 Tax=Streptantibioticus cattleyicolor (strain ATCC 35852 / DSM 46488 / JCM 4925 / NBRC 14057 / NRRL 8057) TaxID=1003195 RepID=G8X0H8_STREN|nr:hypothetical protein SCATT_45220 [Streptantibioticus cattleyicolor NRRL 8057 = DSM 46488]
MNTSPLPARPSVKAVRWGEKLTDAKLGDSRSEEGATDDSAPSPAG